MCECDKRIKELEEQIEELEEKLEEAKSLEYKIDSAVETLVEVARELNYI